MADFKSPVQGSKPSIVDTTITDFRAAIRDLARPNLFQVEMAWPEILQSSAGTGKSGAKIGSQDQQTEEGASKDPSGNSPAEAALTAGYLIKAANIPAATVGVIEVPYRGRTLKIAGDRTFEPWTITVLNDDNFSIRSKFEEWSTKIQALQQNRQSAKTIASYQGSARVVQVGRDSQPSKVYIMKDIWPSNISAIDLAWDSNDTPEEYTVELQVQYWTWGTAEDVFHGKDEDQTVRIYNAIIKRYKYS